MLGDSARMRAANGVLNIAKSGNESLSLMTSRSTWWGLSITGYPLVCLSRAASMAGNAMRFDIDARACRGNDDFGSVRRVCRRGRARGQGTEGGGGACR